MENSDMKWKQFLLIPGGSIVEAKSCLCQRSVHSWAVVRLPFYPPIVFLPGPKTSSTWRVVCLEITEDGLQALSHNFELPCLLWSMGWEGTPVWSRSWLWLCHSRMLPSDCCSFYRAFGSCMYLWPECLYQQLLAFCDCLSKVFFKILADRLITNYVPNGQQVEVSTQCYLLFGFLQCMCVQH